jgi:hypothetical protein
MINGTIFPKGTYVFEINKKDSQQSKVLRLKPSQAFFLDFQRNGNCFRQTVRIIKEDAGDLRFEGKHDYELRFLTDD